MEKGFFIGIPYVNRKDLLIKAIESIKEYSKYIIVFDNSEKCNLELSEYYGVTIYKPKVPHTFAMTLNTFNSMAKENWQSFWFFMHNDVVASSDSIKQLLRVVSYSYTWGVIFTQYDALCVFNTEAFDLVGGFDNNMPWYVSDVEFYNRIKYYNYNIIESGIYVEHNNSQTIQNDFKLKEVIQPFISRMGMEYYTLKWGAQHDHDSFRFVTPFSGNHYVKQYKSQIIKEDLLNFINSIYNSGHSLFNFSDNISYCGRVELFKWLLKNSVNKFIITIGDFSLSIPILFYYLGYEGDVFGDYGNVDVVKQVEIFNNYQNNVKVYGLNNWFPLISDVGVAVIYVTGSLVDDLKKIQDLKSQYIVIIYPNREYKNYAKPYENVINGSIEKENYELVKYKCIEQDEFDIMVYERRRVSINIVTMWYNEEFFAPYFLSHYDYVDKIHVFIDSDTNDRTREICEATPNVVTHSITFPDGLDDEYRFKVINDFIATLTCDWVYVLDADEFIFPKGFEDARKVLARQEGNLIYADMYHVYKNRCEKDLTIDSKPVILQRRYGSYRSITNGLGVGTPNVWYRKPCIVKPETKLRYWHNGVHGFEPNSSVVLCKEDFSGAHWNMADERNAIDRRLNHMKNRQSGRNRELGQDIYKNEDVELIKSVCNMMLDEPQVF